MTDHQYAVWPAFSHCVHFRHSLVGHHNLRRFQAVVRRDKVKELFNMHLIILADDTVGNGTADTVAVFDKQR